VFSIPQTAGITINDFAQVMNTIVHARTVQGIGTEEIFAGALVSAQFKVLVHVKFSAQKVDAKVLTKAQPLTQAAVDVILAVVG
jgi:AP-4 complex subunit epsilon-1